MKTAILKPLLFTLSPITQNLHWLCLIFLLTATFDAIQFFKNELLGIFLAVVSAKIMFSYVLTLPIAINCKLFKYSYITLLLLIIGIFFLIDAYCVIKLNVSLNRNFVAMIKGSNPIEAKEFFNNYGIADVLFYSSTVIVISLTIFFLIKKHLTNIPHWIQGFAILCIVVSSINSMRTPAYRNFYSLIGKINLFKTETEVFNYRDYFTTPNLTVSHNDAPQNIIIIIGESLSKQHCQLYGYGHDNQPALNRLKEDSLLFVFDNVISPGVGTMACFKCFMSTYSPQEHTHNEWYKHTTWIEILEQKGYYSHWISNHSKTGFADNMIGKYADLCDTVYFNNWFNSAYDTRVKYDESLITPIKEFKSISERNDHQLNLYICHVMGSHYTFSSRYPKHYSKFSPNDYPNLLPHQRKSISEYDNSVLYNDFIVSSIIDIFTNDDAVIIYFSDHGLDLYYSSEHYCGHSTTPKGNEYATQIPFMIYTSESYKLSHPEMVQKFCQNRHSAFCTTNLIYTIMNITGVDFADSPKTDKYSLFKNNHKF